MTGKLLLLAIMSVLLTGGMVVGSAAADDASPPGYAVTRTPGEVAQTPMAAAVAAVAAVPAVDFDCSDFPNQASAQATFLAAGGPASDPYRLDADHNGVACESLPCPCSYTVTPTSGPTATATPTPTTAPTTLTSKVLLKVKPKHRRAGYRATFKVTRLIDTGSGLVPTTGRISLEQRLHGTWHTIKGSKKTARDGYATLKYAITGRVKVRAKGKDPETYSKLVKLIYR